MTSSNLRSRAACYTVQNFKLLPYITPYTRDVHIYAYCKHFTLTKQPKMNLSP